MCCCLSAAQHSLTSALPLPSKERACAQEMCWDGPAEGPRCSSPDAGEDAAPAWLASAGPATRRLSHLEHQLLSAHHKSLCHRDTVPLSILLHLLVRARLPVSLDCFYFCFSKGTVENREDQKNPVLFSQESRSELCS